MASISSTSCPAPCMVLCSFNSWSTPRAPCVTYRTFPSMYILVSQPSSAHRLESASSKHSKLHYARPDYSKDFHVVVNTASSVGMGATLMQLEDINDPKSLRPIAFWSHRLNENERGWPVRDQECYGLVCALREWRPYVLGTHTHVKTDHKSLKWLMTTNHSSGSRVQPLGCGYPAV